VESGQTGMDWKAKGAQQWPLQGELEATHRSKPQEEPDAAWNRQASRLVGSGVEQQPEPSAGPRFSPYAGTRLSLSLMLRARTPRMSATVTTRTCRRLRLLLSLALSLAL